MLFATLLSVRQAYAQQIVIDPSAPGLRLGATSVGTPVVDIVTPASGVSLNRFERFNVTSDGLILNNSDVAAANRDGEAVAANPNLIDSGPATVIVNEVTGSESSVMTGTTEVVGGRAEVVVANPNGILCDGCRFVRSSGATLTTGQVAIDGAQVGLNVTEGSLQIGPGGFKSSGEGALIGRHVHIDGPVETYELGLENTLIISGGAQTFDLTTNLSTGGASAIAKTTPFAVDASRLGAMRSGQITIIGNELGLGVNAYGDLNATGKVQLTSAGNLFYGDITADEVTIASQTGEVRQYGDVTATGDVSISADAFTLYAERKITTPGLVSIAADDRIVVVGEIDAGAVDLQTTTGSITNSGFVLADTYVAAYAGAGIANQRKVATEYDVSIDPALQDYVDAYLELLLVGGDEADIAAEMLARAEAHEVIGEYVLRGASISGQYIDLIASAGGFENEGGAVAATRDLIVDVAGDIDNRAVSLARQVTAADGCGTGNCGTRTDFHPGELLSGSLILLYAGGDIRNEASYIAAADHVIADAGAEFVQTLQHSQFSVDDGGGSTGSGEAGIVLAPATVLSLFGDVVIEAGGDVVSEGSAISAGRDIRVSAGGSAELRSFSGIETSFQNFVTSHTTAYWADGWESDDYLAYRTTYIDNTSVGARLITAGADLLGDNISVTASGDVYLRGARIFAEGDIDLYSLSGTVLIDSADVPAVLTESDEFIVGTRTVDAANPSTLLDGGATEAAYLDFLGHSDLLTAVATLARAETGDAIKDAMRSVGVQDGQSLYDDRTLAAYKMQAGIAIETASAGGIAALQAVDETIASSILAFQEDLTAVNQRYDAGDAEKSAYFDTLVAGINTDYDSERSSIHTAYQAEISEIEAEYEGKLTYTTSSYYCYDGGEADICETVYNTYTDTSAVYAKAADIGLATANRDNALLAAEAGYLLSIAGAHQTTDTHFGDGAIAADLASLAAAFDAEMAIYRQDRAETARVHGEAVENARQAYAVLTQAGATLDDAGRLALIGGTVVEGEPTLATALSKHGFADLRDRQTVVPDADGLLLNTRTYIAEALQTVEQARAIGTFEEQTITVEVQQLRQYEVLQDCGEADCLVTRYEWQTVLEPRTERVFVETGAETVNLVQMTSEAVTTTSPVLGTTLAEQAELIEATDWRYAVDSALTVLPLTSRTIVSAEGAIAIGAANDVYLAGATTIAAGRDIDVSAGGRLGILGVADTRFQPGETADLAFTAMGEGLQERILFRGATLVPAAVEGEDATIAFDEALTDYRLANTTLTADGHITLDSLGEIVSFGGSFVSGGNIDVYATLGQIRTETLRFAIDGAIIEGCGLAGRCGLGETGEQPGVLPGEFIAAGNITLDAGDVLRSHGSVFTAGNNLTITAEADIELTTLYQEEAFADGDPQAGRDLLAASGINVTYNFLTQNGVTYYAINDGNVAHVGGDFSIIGPANVSVKALEATVGGNFTAGAGGLLHLQVASDVDSYKSDSSNPSLYLYRDESIGAHLTVGGDAALIGGTVHLEAAQIAAEGDLTIAADGGLIIAAAANFQDAEYAYSKRGFFRSKRINAVNTSLTHTPSILSGATGLVLSAGDDILIAGSDLSAGASIAVDAGGMASVLHVSDQHNYHHEESGGYFGGFLFASSTDHIRNSTVARGSYLEALQDIDLTAEGDITLSASHFTAGGDIRISAGLGPDADPTATIRLAVATEQFYESLQKFSDNGLRWKSVSSGSTSQSVVYNEFDAANVLFSAPGGEVYEVGSDMATLESDVAAVIQRITGRDYNTIAAALANGEITVEEVATWQEAWHHEEVGVSPVAKLVIAAALTIATGPAVFGTAVATGGSTVGLSLGSTVVSGVTGLGSAAAASTTAAVVVNAAVVSFSSQIITGAITVDLDLGEALKSTAISAVTAGLTSGIDAGKLLQLPETNLFSVLRLGNLGGTSLGVSSLVDGAFDAAISSAVLAGAQEGDFADLIQRNMLNFALGRAMAAAQHEVGDLGEYGLGEAHPIRVGLHAVIGCAYAEAAGGDCAGGAAAGATSALYAALLDASGGIEDHARYDGLHTTLAGLVGGITAEIVSGDAEIGNTVASSAALHNYLTDEQRDRLQALYREYKACKALKTADCSPLVQEIQSYNQLSRIQTEILIEVCSSAPSGHDYSTCQDMRRDAESYSPWLRQVWSSHPDLPVGWDFYVTGDGGLPLQYVADLDRIVADVFEDGSLIGRPEEAKREILRGIIRNDAKLQIYETALWFVPGGAAIKLGKIGLSLKGLELAYELNRFDNALEQLQTGELSPSAAEEFLIGRGFSREEAADFLAVSGNVLDLALIARGGDLFAINRSDNTLAGIASAKRPEVRPLDHFASIDYSELRPVRDVLDDLDRLTSRHVRDGHWSLSRENSPSQAGAAFQLQVTGVPHGYSYFVKGVKFDGIKDGVLIDAKDWNYENRTQFLMEEAYFHDWFKDAETMNQARRQIAAANGAPIKWILSDPRLVTPYRNLLRSEKIYGITITAND